MTPRIIMLAGPNGAGKSTFFATHLEDKALPFINADLIAAELEIDAYEAAAVAGEIRKRMVDERKSFITETVFSDPVGAKLTFLKEAWAAGYGVTLFYIGLENPEQSRDRVRARVLNGGHDVPTEKVMARYERTLTNLERAIADLPQVVVYDNSSFEEPYRFLGEFRSGELYERTDGEIPGWAERFFGT